MHAAQERSVEAAPFEPLERPRTERDDLVVRQLQEQPSWSDRRIAEACGVSPKLVGRIRAGLGQLSEEKRVGRDGRRRPPQSGADRERIEAAVRANPTASLRCVAALVGVSPETVRTVKRAILDGQPITRVPARDPQPDHDTNEVLAPLFLLSSSRRNAPSWRADAAFVSTDDGSDFVAFFDATAVHGDARERVHGVPISRTYEIADEARRRAAYWRDLAELLESRVRGRAAI